MEGQACTACARARRRCSKQRPGCLRCQTRDLACYYPASKPSSFVRLASPTPDTSHTGNTPDTLDPLGVPETLDLAPVLTTPSFLSSLSLAPSVLHASSWFASPSTWTIDHAPASLFALTKTLFNSTDLSRLLRRVIGWLADWVDTGSNPFIHHSLYRHRYPSCIQDAYLSLSAYLHKTSANEHMIMRIIEQRVVELVERGLLEGTEDGDTLEYVARSQSLLVYQCIGLYDGDIRLRHLAEKHIPVLESWMSTLMQRASQTLGSGTSLTTSTLYCTTTLLWHTYILAETTRRTWLMVAGIQGIYKLILYNGTVPCCMGGTIFTSRTGFWEAPSAAAWEKRCTEVYSGLVRLTEVDKMMALVPREEVCEFAELVLEYRYGEDWAQRWGL
jgi:hypothetical protein